MPRPNWFDLVLRIAGVTPGEVGVTPWKFRVNPVEISALPLWKFRGYPKPKAARRGETNSWNEEETPENSPVENGRKRWFRDRKCEPSPKRITCGP